MYSYVYFFLLLGNFSSAFLNLIHYFLQTQKMKEKKRLCISIVECVILHATDWCERGSFHSNPSTTQHTTLIEIFNNNFNDNLYIISDDAHSLQIHKVAKKREKQILRLFVLLKKKDSRLKKKKLKCWKNISVAEEKK